VREATQPAICAICKQSITQEQGPYKGLPNGQKAHLACYPDHMDDDGKNPAP
jgi:hypothetical protein